MKKYVAYLLSCIVIAGGIWGYVVTGEAGESKVPGPANNKKMPPLVDVKPVTTLDMTYDLELTGTVDAYKKASLASPAEGPVIALEAREGDQVDAGQLLAELGRNKGVFAVIASRREELKKEELNLDRIENLVESRALPGEELDKAWVEYEKVKAQLIQAEEYTRDHEILAPWSGVISKILVKEGEFVSPRLPLLEVFDPASLVVFSSVPERYSARIVEGMQVDVRLDAYPGEVLPGIVERVYPYLDAKHRTRTVEIAIDKNINLFPGMFARLSLQLERVEQAVAVPGSAVLMGKNGPVLFVHKDGKAYEKNIITGIEQDGLVQIVSGIVAEDSTIVAGNEKLRNGSEVRPMGKTTQEKSGKRPDDRVALLSK